MDAKDYFYIVDKNNYYLCAKNSIGYVFSSDTYIILQHGIKYTEEKKAIAKSKEFDGTSVVKGICINV